MGVCCWYLRGGAWRSRTIDILGICVGFVIIFGGVEIHSAFLYFEKARDTTRREERGRRYYII